MKTKGLLFRRLYLYAVAIQPAPVGPLKAEAVGLRWLSGKAKGHQLFS